MNIQKDENGNFHIRCSRDELIIISNALNNIPQAVDENEYTSLIGASKPETVAVLDLIVSILKDTADH